MWLRTQPPVKCGGRGFHAARRRAGIGAAPTRAWPRTSSDVWAVDDPAPLRRARGRYFPRDGCTMMKFDWLGIFTFGNVWAFISSFSLRKVRAWRLVGNGFGNPQL